MTGGQMQVSVTTTKGLERRLEVAVPGERVANEVDARLKRLARTARLKGFRPGKVPFSVVRQQFGSQVHAEAVNDLVQSTFAEAVSQQKLRPAGGPRIEPIAAEPGNELRYAAIFEILPEVTLRPLDGIAVEQPVAAVSDEDVDAMIESMRSQRPDFTEVQRAAQDGDRVTVDFEGRVDGQVFPGGKADGFQVAIGAHRVLPEFEQGLIGMSAGDSKTIQAQFPADYGSPVVAGKLADFDLKVSKVEERVLPPVDEAFAVAFGVQQGGVPELRKEVRSSMERELAETVRGRLREQFFDAIYRDNPVEVPRSMLDSQVRDLQVQALRRMGTQDLSKAPSRESLEPGARRRVALGLLIGEIVRQQGIKVDRERVEQKLDAVTSSYPDPQQAKRQYLSSREAMEQLESSALEDQALDWALTQVKVIDKPSSFRELTGFGQTQ
jgi:trigger factor